MKSIKIAIISKNDKIRDFFRLEALNLGFSIDCFEKVGIHTDLSCYDLSIIDIDTIDQKPLNPSKKEITVSEKNTLTDISYPINVSDIQKIYLSILNQNELISEMKEPNDFKIIFYKDEKNVISIKNKKYLLSDAEYNLLKLLCKNYPNAILREDIDKMFSYTNSNISDVYICKLRKKLEEPLDKKLISTVRSKGYKILIKSEWR